MATQQTSEPVWEHGGTLWGVAVAVAGLGNYLLFDASPGVNWGLWTLAASVGLLAFAGTKASARSSPLLPTLALACALAFGAFVTADQTFHSWLATAVMVLLAMAMLLANDARAERVSLAFIAVAPCVALGGVIVEVVRRTSEACKSLGGQRTPSALRGAMLALPIVAVFALLLANADPLFAAWRDGVLDALSGSLFVPRLLFFVLLLAVVLGAYGFAARESTAVAVPVTHSSTRFRVGETERLIVLGSVASLFALFLIVQTSYLFGNVAARAGSGVTFAEYARRGFGELTIVTTLCGLLMLFLERFGERGTRETWVRMLQLLLVLELQLLLLSAFRRVWLYETAYGFTTARLYAQAYMAFVGLVLTMLAWELRAAADLRRLGRRAAALCALAVAALSYWNHEGWIAGANLDRYAVTGKLDAHYIVWGLSPNAVPTVIAALDHLPTGTATELRKQLHARYGSWRDIGPDQWFEWNLRRASARAALRSVGIAVATRAE